MPILRIRTVLCRWSQTSHKQPVISWESMWFPAYNSGNQIRSSGKSKALWSWRMILARVSHLLQLHACASKPLATDWGEFCEEPESYTGTSYTIFWAQLLYKHQQDRAWACIQLVLDVEVTASSHFCSMLHSYERRSVALVCRCALLWQPGRKSCQAQRPHSGSQQPRASRRMAEQARGQWAHDPQYLFDRSYPLRPYLPCSAGTSKKYEGRRIFCTFTSRWKPEYERACRKIPHHTGLILSLWVLNDYKALQTEIEITQMPAICSLVMPYSPMCTHHCFHLAIFLLLPRQSNSKSKVTFLIASIYLHQVSQAIETTVVCVGACIHLFQRWQGGRQTCWVIKRRSDWPDSSTAERPGDQTTTTSS